MDVSTTCIRLTRHFFPESERQHAVLVLQLLAAEAQVIKHVNRPLLPHQQDALICLLSDVESSLTSSPYGPFPESFLLKCLNEGMFHIAAAEFHSFCYLDGELDPRMYAKRQAEHYLFTRGKLYL